VSDRKTWLVTGAAGFIGSHLVEALLKDGQVVRGLDNFATGKRANLAGFQGSADFSFIEGDICDPAICRAAVAGVDVILHQAALGSVPRSLVEPAKTHAANVTGFLNMLIAAREAGVKRFVYASSSSVYGDDPELPKREERVGRPLSPYAATKAMNEMYAGVFARQFGLETIGLRYFNVFGPRQDPEGAYAAVIPAWVAALIRNQPVHINGDGETSRDFCYVANVVQANIAAGSTISRDAVDQVYNIALGEQTTLNQLFTMLSERLGKKSKPIHQDFRSGDVRHSLADISKAQRLLHYKPTHSVSQGLDEALDWYVKNL